MPEKIFAAVFLFLVCLIIFRMARKITPVPGTKGAKFDAGILAALKKHGDALTTERPIDVYLYLPTEAAANLVAEEISKDGFTIDRVGVEPKSKTYACQASKPMIPALANIESMRATLEAVASSHGGEFDGWGCAVTKS